jgi:hypothetical protein
LFQSEVHPYFWPHPRIPTVPGDEYDDLVVEHGLGSFTLLRPTGTGFVECVFDDYDFLAVGDVVGDEGLEMIVRRGLDGTNGGAWALTRPHGS